jgi:2'-5' RNA ligase
MPKPRQDEGKEGFIGRCMRYPDLQKKPLKQRLGMCYGLWREHRPADKTEKSACKCHGACAKCRDLNGVVSRLYQPVGITQKLANAEAASLVNLNTELESVITDDGEMSATGILCTSRRDWVGDVVNIEGVDFKFHRANPVVLWDHGKWDPKPIGITETPQGQYTVVKDLENEIITQKTYFNKLDHAQQIYHLVRERQIRANSIAFKDLVVHKLPPDPGNGLHKPGRYVETCALVECSWVPAGMNPDAVLTLLGKEKVEGDPLHWTIRKSFEQFGFHIGRPTSVTVPDMGHVDGITRKSALDDQWQEALRRELGGAYDQETHDFCSTQLELPESEVRQALVSAGLNIDPEDLAEKHADMDVPHCTVLYGIHADHKVNVSQLVAASGRDWPVTLEFGAISVFEQPEHDVLIVEIRGKGLRPLRNFLRDNLPNTQTHPAYRPHITVAYVKPGKGQKYIGKSGLEGREISVQDLVYSNAQGSKVVIPLMTSSPLAPPFVTEKVIDSQAVAPMSAFNEGRGGAMVPFGDKEACGVCDVANEEEDEARERMVTPDTPREYISERSKGLASYRHKPPKPERVFRHKGFIDDPREFVIRKACI